MKIDPDKDFGSHECPSCATEVPANSNRCPICGYEFPVRGGKKSMRFWGALVMLILFLILIFGLS